MDPRIISINDYSYSLEDDRIAKYPLAERDASRLLIYRDGNISEDTYSNIAVHIPENSLMIFNNTKVIEARLLFQKSTGGIVEIFCLEPHRKYPDVTTAMLQQEKVLWQCLIGGASKWKAGQVLDRRIINDVEEIFLRATYVEKQSDSFIVELAWSPPGLSFAEVLHHAGAIPLPPYIKREVESSDAERYQTVYAQYDGSVAAPTAGLHFTPGIFKRLNEKKIKSEFLTLHVGSGTFKPVKAATLGEHEMHAELMQVSSQTIETILNNLDKNIIAVGTTSLRSLESLYWLGVKTHLQPGFKPGLPTLQLLQWEAYELKKYIAVEDALESLLKYMKQYHLEQLFSKTQLIIAPGYKAKIPKALITNFHQPGSTLLLLVAALIGNDWKKVYDYAMEKGYRFLSYGDGSLLWINS